MALWPNNRTDILGFQPANLVGQLAFQETRQRTERTLSYFAGEQIEETSSVPEGAFPGAAIIAPLESGGMSTSIIGSGRASGPAIMALLAVASLAGSGGATALGGLIVNLAATIAGSGGVSSAAVQAFLNLLAAISGSGGASGTGTGIGGMDATMTGQGSTASTATGIGAMGATLRGYGELTPEGLRDAVWSAIALSNNTPGTMGAALNAAGSGGVDLNALAAAVWAYATRTLTASDIPAEQQTQILEIWQRLGLDPAAPMTTSTSAVTFDGKTIDITEVSGNVTLTRQP